MLGQSLLLDYGDPNRLNGRWRRPFGIKLTGINSAGHRHIRSSYYSGTRVAEEEPGIFQTKFDSRASSGHHAG